MNSQTHTESPNTDATAVAVEFYKEQLAEELPRNPALKVQLEEQQTKHPNVKFGYAPEIGTALTEYLAVRGFSVADALQSGFVRKIPGPGCSIYDALNGHLVAFKYEQDELVVAESIPVDGASREKVCPWLQRIAGVRDGIEYGLRAMAEIINRADSAGHLKTVTDFHDAAVWTANVAVEGLLPELENAGEVNHV